MVMASQQPVLEESCTYFHSASKKWILGLFTLGEHHFRFRSQENNKVHNILVPLNAVCSLEKKQSKLIYACVVITTDSEKHWFSSFPNRDTVYNLLELFWRGSLLSKSYKTESLKPKGDTALGKELLGILYESESSLVTSANVLVDQGRQLQESQAFLENVNTDLTKAEKILKTFNSPQFFSLNKQTKLPKDEEIKNDESFQRNQYKVTYTFSKTSKDSWEKGTLIITNKLVLLDENQSSKMEIDKDSLEKFQVITPWEFCLLYSSGFAFKSCFFMCPQLSGLLKNLNSHPNLKAKIVFEEEDTIENIPSCSSSSHSYFKPIPVLSEELILTSSNILDKNSVQAQSLDKETIISDKDVEEMSSLLNNLQVLASEVCEEQKQQMENINSLITDVEKTELRIQTNIKNIKKIA